MIDFADRLEQPGRLTVGGVPDAARGLVLASAAKSVDRPVLFIARDETRMTQLAEQLTFFAPELKVGLFPSWDCVPYDRVSPNGTTVAARIDLLTKLAAGVVAREGYAVLTTVAAVTQKLPARAVFADASIAAKPGMSLPQDKLNAFFARNGYRRSTTVREAGEFAVRGGILDVFPAGEDNPFRLDFFGDELESIRRFDAMTQRSIGDAEEMVLGPVSEVFSDDGSIARFRQNYRELFGGSTEGDMLFEAVSEGRRPPGVEHWLPLFHEAMETLLDYLPDAPILFDYQADEALEARWELVKDHYDARHEALEMAAKRRGASGDGQESLYKPIPLDALYLDRKAWIAAIDARARVEMGPFKPTDLNPGFAGMDLNASVATDFSAARADKGRPLFQAVAERLSQETGRASLICAHSEGARERIHLLLREAGYEAARTVTSWREFKDLKAGAIAVTVLPMERGFSHPDAVLYSEEDILGERLARPARRRRRGEEFISELSALEVGDVVVHMDHGIGRYDGLETLTIDKAPHDCLRILYAGDDKLYVPVENIEMLSRFGSEDSHVQLDKLGGVAWQARKAKLKERVKEMAAQLLKVAADRALRRGEVVEANEGAYDEFCARFEFAETEDQLRAIADVTTDLASGRAMDRLICGDVGFGKTEVALRAAFLIAMSGLQVAVVVPTTLLARQHFRLFKERFDGLPVKIGQLSRLVTGKAATAVKDGFEDGSIDIVVGTHALLAKSIRPKRLGLLIVDEEQHFGVQQKERLKQLKSNVHVMTLTATPIPRTLQMALAGVREMSIIATPPVDRLAIRTFVLPYDPVILREAIRRERFRGGQIFYVCPRIADLDRVRERLREMTPNASVAVAHGQMPSADLERVMSDFVDGRYDILLSTNIVESGLDIPNANTMIVHRADMFGLAQLYQLRGRIGRGKQRAYCYLTLPPGRVMSPTALKRLEVMQTLDTLGAGFTLASHDLDIRGAGNLLGEEQSGHIKEVGVELYQRMLEEAIAAAREGGMEAEAEETWSPTIALGAPVLIPEKYVTDLPVRLGLYRRLSEAESAAELDAMAVELVDRFGALPKEVENLLEVCAIKQACKRAGVAKLDAGPKGAVITFRNDRFAKPEKLIGYIQQQAGSAKVRPDQKLVLIRAWEGEARRLKGVKQLAETLAKLAE